MVRSPLKATVWLWTKVGLALAALDVALFWAGLFWSCAPELKVSALTGWPLVYQVARLVETEPVHPGTSFIVGSSAVALGVVPLVSNAMLKADGVPVELTKLSMFGASATDAALLAWSGRRLRPWLVIYGAALRDFGRELERDSPAARVFYDASLRLPALPREGAEEVAEAYVKRYWKLYRYQFFARAALETLAYEALGRLASARSAFAAGGALPPEAQRWFGPSSWMAITPQAYALWQHWRVTRRFDDYAAYLRERGLDPAKTLREYTWANLDPERNPHVESLRWMLDALPRRGSRVVVVYFPENPAFRDPDARAYFDPALSDTYAALLAHEAARGGAGFVDLRGFLEPDDFHDVLHLNVEGNTKLSKRIAAVVAGEWRAR